MGCWWSGGVAEDMGLVRVGVSIVEVGDNAIDGWDVEEVGVVWWRERGCEVQAEGGEKLGAG